MDLKEEEILGEAVHDHWYYVSKGRALRDFIRGFQLTEVLDVGAGSGVFSKMLIADGIVSKATCVDPNYADIGVEEYERGTLTFVRSVSEVTQSLVLLMDVLEHVDDDVALLADYVGKCRNTTTFAITVPAFQFLWSGHDVFLEHHRRYSLTQVEEMVRAAGLKPLRSSYFFGSLFPAVAAMRLLKSKSKTEPKSELKSYPRLLNSLLIGIHDIERRSIFPWNRLAGLSVFCLCTN